MIKVLLTGSKGQLGVSIERLNPKGIQLISLDKNQFNLSKINEIKKKLKEIKPDFIINCGAYTNVDNAEIEKDKAIRVNYTAPKILSKLISEKKLSFFK